MTRGSLKLRRVVRTALSAGDGYLASVMLPFDEIGDEQQQASFCICTGRRNSPCI